MPRMEATASELGFFRELMCTCTWRKEILPGLEYWTYFRINKQEILCWHNVFAAPDPEYRWYPSAIHIAAMEWFTTHQPQVTNLVIEMLTKRGYTWVGSCPRGKEERADRIVQVWKFLAEKYRGEQ